MCLWRGRYASKGDNQEIMKIVCCSLHWNFLSNLSWFLCVASTEGGGYYSLPHSLRAKDLGLKLMHFSGLFLNPCHRTDKVVNCCNNTNSQRCFTKTEIHDGPRVRSFGVYKSSVKLIMYWIVFIISILFTIPWYVAISNRM